MKSTSTITALLLLLFNFSMAQDFQFGKISDDKSQKLKCVAGVIGKSIYTCSFKDNDLYINKCSPQTLAIEESKKVDIGTSDLKKNSWDVLKVDNKIVFVIAVWDRDAPNKVYGKTVVESDGTINATGALKFISDWESPVINGKKITMGRDIKMTASPELDGFPTTNNKLLVYYVNFSMISATNGNKDNLIKAILLDKDLNKLDEQNLEFDKKEENHLGAFQMDVDGNFYVISRAFNPSSRTTNHYCFIYDYKKKQINKTLLVLDKLKGEDKPSDFSNLSINSKNNLSFTGFYGPYGKYGVLSVTGFATCETTLKGEFKYDILSFEMAGLDKHYTPTNKKTENFTSHVNIDMTENYVVVTKTNEGRSKKGEVTNEYYSEYSILKKAEGGKFKVINSYVSELTNIGGFYTIVKPKLVEGNNKLFMVFAPNKFFCGSYNQKKYFDQICMLHTFDFNGTLSSTFLYDVEKTNPLPDFKYKLSNNSYVYWGEDKQGPVKVDFK